MNVGRTLDKPVFVLGCHKSGTSLVRSLLDSHPKIYAIPFETHLFEHLGWPIVYPIRPRPYRQVSWTACLNSLLDTVAQAGDSRLGGSSVEHVDLDRFSDVVTAALRQSHSYPPIQSVAAVAKIFEIVVTATLSSQRLTNVQECVVEKSVDHMEFGDALAAAFPGARFIHIIRDPVDNIVTLRNYVSGQSYPVLRPLIEGIRLSMVLAHRNSAISTRYMVIRYEDLVMAPQPTMERVADHLEISYDEGLLNPTVSGEKWGGNSLYVAQRDRISTGSVGIGHKSATVLERAAISKELGALAAAFGYRAEYPSPNLVSLSVPGPGERPRQYILNRLEARHRRWHRHDLEEASATRRSWQIE